MARIVGMRLTEQRKSQTETCACPHCGRAYKSEAALQEHVKSKHPDMLDETGPGGGQE